VSLLVLLYGESLSVGVLGLLVGGDGDNEGVEFDVGVADLLLNLVAEMVV
jgi:hypothetical protein